jgi:membrane-bound lytic murein transglycosylase D
VSLAVVARAAGVEAEVVEELNPHLMRGITPPGETWQVRVPLNRGGAFAANFERILAETPDPVEYVIRRGETLSHIARRFGVGVDDLRAANGGLDPRRIQAGQRIRVPVEGGVVALASQEQAQQESTWKVHRVRSGDTLWDIARRYDVSVSQLRSWNALSTRSAIRPGQQLRVRNS